MIWPTCSLVKLTGEYAGLVPGIWHLIPLTNFRASENFPPKFGSISFDYLRSLNFMQNIKKATKRLMSQYWEKCCSNGQMDKLGHFGPFWPNFQKFRLHQFWVLNFMQNIKKKLMSQSWEKYCSSRQMDKLGHFRPFWFNFGQAKIFPTKSSSLVLSAYGLSTSCKN